MPKATPKKHKDKYVDDILKAINSAEKVINEVKGSGIDIQQSEKLIGLAMQAYKDKDDRKVMFYVKKAEALAKDAWKNYYMKLTAETVTSTRKSIDEVKDAGLDTIEAEELFAQALELVEQKDFKLAEDYLKKAVAKANEVWNTSKASSVSDAIASIHSLIMEAKEIGVDVSEAETQLLKAITHFKNEEYEQSDEIIKMAVLTSREAWDKYRSAVAAKGISESFKLVRRAKSLGIDIAQAEILLNEAEVKFKENNYDDIEDLLNRVDEYIKGQMKNQRTNIVEKSLKGAEKLIDEGRAIGVDVAPALELMKQAKAMFKAEDFDSVEDYIRVIETLIRDERARIESETAAESITTTESRLREIENRVGESTADDALSETRALLEKLKQLRESDKTTIGELSNLHDQNGKGSGPARPERAMVQSPVQEVYEWGATYICKEPKSQKSFQLYLDLIKSDIKGLCISRMHPDKLMQYYDLKDSTIWLSKTQCEHCRNPSNLGKLAFTINQFLETNPSSVILLDGLEYLINNNDFSMVLRFIDEIHESSVINNAILIVPVSPASYGERELTLLDRNSLQLTDNHLNNIQKFLEKYSRSKDRISPGKTNSKSKGGWTNPKPAG